MLSNHFLANQIAGKTVRISCPIRMCWIELTVQFCGTSTGRVEWLSRWSIGCYVCASRLKAHCQQNQDSIYFGVRKRPSKDMSFLPPLKKKLAKVLKWYLSYEKSVFWFEKEMYPSENRCGIEKISVSFMYILDMCFIITIYNSLPFFYQMEVYTVRMTSVSIVMMVSFNLHTK